jgi:RNA polymerase sigma-70 factor (ECF subfamily)
MTDAMISGTRSTGAAHDFDSWVASEWRRIELLCRRLLQNHDEAASATQDVFLKAWRAVVQAQARTVEDPAAWLTTVALNVCLDRIRSRRWRFWMRRLPEQFEQHVLSVIRESRPGVEERLYASQIERRLGEALERLSPRQRAIFVLKHYEDRKLDEIAALMGLEPGTVKAHMSRAVTRLRRELRDLYGCTR